MPDHVHAIFEPFDELSTIMRWLKGRTARKSNRIIGREGQPFWQDESFDHWIRSDAEFQKLVQYVENNPVRSGLVEKLPHGDGRAHGSVKTKVVGQAIVLCRLPERCANGRPQKTMACPTRMIGNPNLCGREIRREWRKMVLWII
jgi:hypothetical protein